MRGGPRIFDALGIVLTVLAAALLALVLAQVLELGRQAGLSRGALTRERVGVAVTARILTSMNAFDRFRSDLMVRSPHVPRSRALAQGEVDRLRGYLTIGQGASFDLRPQWRAFESDWATVRKLPAGPGVLPRSGALFDDFGNLLTAVEQKSGLNYDPSPSAQNLADIYVQETPFAISGTRRILSITDVAAQQGGLTLAQRLDAAGNLSTLRNGYDLSGDQVPEITNRMSELAPQDRSQWARLPGLSARMNSVGSSFADLVARTVMLQPRPSVSPAVLHRQAAQTIDAVTAMNRAAGAALDANLVERGRIQAESDRYQYLAWVLSGIVIAGIMVAVAQLIALRGRRQLEYARRESDRLQAELARQEAEEALRLTEAQFRTVFDGAAIGIAVLSRAGTIVDANGVYRAMYGDSASPLEGHENDLERLWAGERDTFEFEAHQRGASGREIWTDATVSIVRDEIKQARFAICMFRDKTELKHSERRIAHGRMHDALTSLPNRTFFEVQLGRRFEEAGALLDSFFAVLFVDLGHFKEINESLGHTAGDLVLTQVAARLRTSVDARDVVARLGGDEFAVLLQSLGDILHVESTARKILSSLSKAISIGPRSVFVSASIGIAIGSASYERASDVMRDAETAMQHAKASGGARYALFDSTMRDRAQKRLQLISDLRLAVERNEFRMVYQPIVSIEDGAVLGCEALIRWDHPSRGIVGPAEFIPLAEQTGLSMPIGRFVMQSACQQLSAWRRNRNGALDFGMHVNVSATELVDPEFERSLVQIVEHHGLRPSDFVLEITESVVLDQGTRANQTLGRVRRRGFRICIDDFGTGYSSLRYLQQFEVDAIKIDRSFVTGNDGQLASEPIVATLVTLAEAYDVRVVAEGVETTEQMEMLRTAGCRYAQGFLFARPLAGAELTERYPRVLGRIIRPASA